MATAPLDPSQPPAYDTPQTPSSPGPSDRDIEWFMQNRGMIVRAYGPQTQVAVLDGVIIDAGSPSPAFAKRALAESPGRPPYVSSIAEDVTRRIMQSYEWVQRNEDDLLVTYGRDIHLAMVGEDIIDVDKDPGNIQARLSHRGFPEVVVIVDFRNTFEKSPDGLKQKAFLYSPFDLEIER